MRPGQRAVAVLLLVLCAGCARAPLRLQEVAVIRNEATARYAFVGRPRFLVCAEPVDVVVLGPVAATEDRLAASKSRSSAENAALEARSAGSRVEVGGSTAETVGKASRAASTKHEHAARVEKEAADATTSEREHAARVEREAADARSVEREHVSRTEVAAADAGTQVRLAEARSSRTSFRATQASETHRHEVRSAAYESVVEDRTMAAGSMWSYSRPCLKKMAATPQAVVGERLDFILEFRNETAFDLAAVEIVDLLPPGVEPLVNRISLTPSLRFSADWKEGQLLILIPHGVSRGQAVRIQIPTIVREDAGDSTID